MFRSLPAPGGETLTPACGRGSPASTSGRTAAGWQRLSGQSSRGNSPQHCGSTSSLVPSRADGACRLEHHWDDPGTPWLSCSSDAQGAGGLLQQCDRAAASSWGASRRRRVVACSLSSTLAPVHGWGSSITEAMARALVPPNVPVAPSLQPSLAGSLGDATLGDGPNLSGLLLDHVNFMRFVGYAVLVGACFRSIPQILRILRAKSATGVSLSANIAELLAYSITVAYNSRNGYPFSTYGEVVACWLQDIVLIALICRFSGVEDWRMLCGSALFGLLCWWLLSTGCNLVTLRVLQASTICIIALGGRLPQILLNVRRGGSGELSLTTCLLNLMGNITRIFTTLVLTQDRLIVAGNVVQGCFNGVLLWQTAATTARRAGRAGKQLSERTAEDEEEPVGVSPAAIEAAESDTEDGSGVAGDAGAAAAPMGGDGGAGIGGGDGGGGGYGGLGSALFEPSLMDMPIDSGDRGFD